MDKGLREKVMLLLAHHYNGVDFVKPHVRDIAYRATDKILDLIRTEKGLIHKEMVDSLIDSAYDLGKYDREKELKGAGWKSPEEVNQRIEMILGGNNK